MHNLLITILIICFCFVVYTLYLGYPIYRAKEISSKMIADTTPYEQKPQNPDQLILVAGDSTAVGVGSIDNGQSTAGRLGHQFSKAHIVNIGMSGARLKDLLLALRNQKKEHYDLILIQIGANDVTNLTPYDEIRAELLEVLSLSSQIGSKIIILTAGNIGLAPIFRWPLSSYMTSRTLKVREIFIEESSKYKHVSYIDLFEDLKNDPLEKNIEKNYAPDLFHLTGDGYGMWYKFIKNAL